MIRIGVLCPSEIAFRRFMPALAQADGFVFVGIGSCAADELFGSPVGAEAIVAAEREKARRFVEAYGGKQFSSYRELASSDEVDAVYIPLPPALHYRWAKFALECGKHVLVEKPSTLRACQTKELAAIAAERGLALHENYMFAFHAQLRAISEIVESGELGKVRLYSVRFGFPMRGKGDFRYQRQLGGGALIDAGGYTLRYAAMLLGDTARVASATMNVEEGFDVDLYGSGTLVNDRGETVQIAYGMDQQYKCELEVWGSLATLHSGRILTAPAGFVPSATIECGSEKSTRTLPADDTFLKSLLFFEECTKDPSARERGYRSAVSQAELVDSFRAAAGMPLGEDV